MKIEAELELENEEEIVKTVYESIKEESDIEKDKRRSFVVIALKGNKLSVCIRGEDMIRVRAAANTWLRLLKIAEEMVQVVRECDFHGS